MAKDKQNEDYKIVQKSQDHSQTILNLLAAEKILADYEANADTKANASTEPVVPELVDTKHNFT